MSNPVWVVLENPNTWQIWRLDSDEVLASNVSLESEMDATVLSQLVAAALRAAGYRQEPILLALASTSCLAATIDLTKFPQSVSDDTLRFELEAMLPISAEQMHAVFVRSPKSACAVALSRIDWHSRLAALEDQGLVIHTLMPAAWLGLHHAAVRAVLPESAIILWRMSWGWELWQLAAGQVTGWWSVRASMALVKQHLQFLTCQTCCSTPLLVITPPSEIPDEELFLSPGTTATALQVDFQVAAQQAAERLLRGREPPCLELRTGVLGSREPWRPIRHSVWSALSASILLLTCVSLSLLWRAQQMTHLAGEFHQKQEQLFQEIFPNQPVPVAVRSRLTSEAAKLRMLQSEQRDEPTLNSALEPFGLSVRSIPPSANHHITLLNIDGSTLQLQGEVSSVGEAAHLAEAFTTAGFEVSGPSTTQQSGGRVAFSLSAILKTGGNTLTSTVEP